ncbi:MAG: undecaprenyldiphospho-muramoylpentapeptide beta-N-acetylglucosaminyltransferase [Bacteroidales bacterium]
MEDSMEAKKMDDSMNVAKPFKLIISGGGTGGHVFPAIAIANAVKEFKPDAEILFVGANGRMEMEKVPAAGYKIIGLKVVGLNRKKWWRNITLPYKLLLSFIQTHKILKNFKPDVVVGVGGYASAPTLFLAERMGIPCLIQEQNSFPGVTNRILGKRACKICVDYEHMEKFFPKEKIVWTGNPIRQDIVNLSIKKEEGLAFFGLDMDKKTILIIGGSLGARSINTSVMACLQSLLEQGYQVLWQTGTYYYAQARPLIQDLEHVIMVDFIRRMDLAYAAADIVISRGGAIAISELCVVGKPIIIIPSPNVAEDHQTKNALALSSKNAAILLPDDKAQEDLGPTVLALMQDERRKELMSENISRLAKTSASTAIANEIFKLQKK